KRITEWDSVLIAQGTVGHKVFSVLSDDHKQVTYFLSDEFEPIALALKAEPCEMPSKASENSLKLVIGDPSVLHSSE
ncbi:hypothetical protein, partial [Aeromonas hydrophila]